MWRSASKWNQVLSRMREEDRLNLMERLLRYLVVNYHLTRSQIQLVSLGFDLMIALGVIAVILVIRKALRPSSDPQPACPACGAATKGSNFCPECGHQMFQPKRV